MISVKDIAKSYGSHKALSPTTHEFVDSQTTVLIGPSGCGKSTLLRCIIGVIQPDSGTVSIDGKIVTPESQESVRREIGYVIQDGGLFPHLTARENVLLLAHYIRRPQNESNNRVAELADLVSLSQDYLDHYPSALSGGQKQRVSLMRALMLNPKVLLLDEPFGALDPITRSELQTEMRRIFSELKKTVVMVTHDMGEAAYFADQIVLMKDGKIIQQGTIEDLFQRPADQYVTTFIQAQRSPLPSLPEVQ